jgi:uncharacterized delta-60 repeat protein
VGLLRGLGQWLRRAVARGDTAAVRAPVVEALEPRLLYSADLHPLAWAQPVEVRLIESAPQPAATLDAAVEAATDPAATTSTTRTSIVFVHADIANVQQLVAGIDPAAEVVMLERGADGLAAIEATLQGRSDIGAIHLIGEGTSAELHLGGSFLTQASMTGTYAEQLRAIGAHLAAEADILVYGCNFAAGEAGADAMRTLAQLTGADIAASTNRTGHAAEHGDWVLEASTGDIEAAVAVTAAAQQGWSGALATYTVTNTNNSGAGSLRQAITDANANAGTDTIVFNIALTDANHVYYRDNGVAGTFSAPVTTTLADAAITNFDADYAAGTARSWYRISLTGAGLDITQAVIIDGSTQSGYDSAKGPIIEIDASGITSPAGDLNAIALTTGASTIRGLVINGAGDNAIEVDTGAGGSVIVGNYFGTDVSGTVADGNSTVGTWGAIAIKANNVVVGGTTAADRNLISGNNGFGIELYSSASGAVITGNYIGTTVTGTGALGNAAAGITLRNSAGTATIGGTATGASNLIAFNAGDGVWVQTGAGNSNAIIGNRVHSNSGLGIDLGTDGVTANDTNDADSGANDLLNFPIVTRVVQNGVNLDITLVLDVPAGNYRIELFENPAGIDASRHGEGQVVLGALSVTSAGTGAQTFSGTLNGVTATSITRISATATRDLGSGNYASTSEFGPRAGLVVSTTNDTLDGTTTSAAALIANPGADGHISLREAITAANASSGIDYIYFDITAALVGGVHTITLTYDGPDAGTTPDALPIITSPVFISGWTEPDYAGSPIIELNGNNVGTLVKGLELGAGSDGSTVRGLIINRFTGTGLEIQNSSNHVIQGNWIGLNASGTAASANGNKGIYALNATGLLIGSNADGTNDAAERNVVSGNAQQNIFFDNTDNSTIAGNYVGTNVAGTGDVNGSVANTAQSGVFLTNGSSGNVIGGTVAAARNILSGNNHFGFEALFGSQNNLLQGNYIGTDVTGLVALGNINGGAVLWGAGTGNVIGGNTASRRNVIAGNTYNGVVVGNATTGGTIQGNYIGIGADGVTSLGNGSSGVRVEGGSTNVLIGTNADGTNDAAEANVISANTHGVTVAGSGSTGTVIAGNIIGLAADGDTIRANTSYGVNVGSSAANTTIGGTSSVSRNIISGNASFGIYFASSTSGNSVFGNYIGTNAAGTAARANLDGIWIDGSANNTIGQAGSGNLISGNTYYGVVVDAAGATGNVIRANLIGTNAAGTGALGNGAHGILVQNSASSVTVGGTTAGHGNTIAYNAGDGVFVSAGTGVSILGNAIYSNTDQGIDLGTNGVAVNDAGDGDSGANNLQNFPVIYAVSISGGNVTITGEARPGATVEFFEAAVDAGGYGEGQVFLGRGTVPMTGVRGTTDASAVQFSFTFAVGSLVVGDAVTATATDASGNTSEFSLNVAAAAAANTAPSFFAGDGSTVTPVGAHADSIRAIAIQSDGRTVVVGGVNNGGSNTDIFVARYNADGTLDASFGTGGIVVTAITGNADWAESVAIQADGKIVVAGSRHNGLTNNFAVLRYHSDGTLDTTFGGTGIVTFAFSSSHEQAQAVRVQADGKIVVAGYAEIGGNEDFAVARLNSDGTLDATFDTDGKATTAIGTAADRIYDIAIQADGKIVAAGSTDNGTDTDVAIVRYTGTGALDATFDGDGRRVVPIGTGFDVGYAVALQSDGKIVVAGDDSTGVNSAFTVVRLNTDGSLDTTFSGDGIASTMVGALYDHGHAVAIQSDGKIVVAGESFNGSNNDIALVRFNSGGTLDTSFDGDGKLTTTLGSSSDSAAAVALQPDGTIVVGGYGTFANNDAVILRYHTNGSLDTRFGLWNTLDASPTFTEGASAVVLDANVQVFDAQLTAADNFNGATLTLARNGGANAQDLFSATGMLAALTQGGALVVGGTTIGTVTANSNGTLVLTFNAGATNVLVNSAMQQIAYANASAAPPASVQINWTFSDGNSGAQGSGGALQAAGSTTVNITAVNDAPAVATTGAALAYTENGAATAVDGALTVTDADSVNLTGATVTISANYASGQDLLAFTNQLGITGSWNAGTGVLTLTGTTTLANYQAALRSITYINTSDNPSTATRTVSFVVADGGANSNVATRDITVAAVNDAPVVSAPGGALSATEDLWIAIDGAGFGVSDADAAGGALTMTLQVTQGHLTVDLGDSGVAIGSGNNTASVVLTGTVAQLNNLLTGGSTGFLRYTPSVNAPAAATTLAVSVDDGGNTGSDPGLTGTGSSEAGANSVLIHITATNDAPTGAPAVTGTPTENQTLGVDVSAIADADGLGTFGYQWQRNGTNIGGATGATYVLGDADVGASIRVVVSYTDAYGTPESLTSAAVGPVVNVNDAPTGSVTIDDTTPTQGQTLTAANTLADLDGLGPISYQWQRGGVDIAGATGSTYVTTQADVGSVLRVVASYTDAQGTPESVASADTAAVANVNDPPTGGVSIDDTTPTQGQTLTASNTLADADGLGVISYQWQRAGVDIAGATGSTYVTTQADVGSALRVVASYTDAQGTPESVASADTAAVANVNDPPTGGVAIDDTTPTQGQTLTAANTLADADGLGVISYQWQRGGVDIAGATGSTYVTTQADVGSVLRVVASYVDGQATAESVASADTAAVANVNDAPSGGVAIDDTTPTQGQTLTAANTLADADGLGVISYQWQRGGVDIAGATGATYTAGQADVGQTLTVVASYTDSQGTAESVASAATTAVANVNDAPTGSVTIDDTTPTQGQALTASNTLGDLDGLGSISYQWQRGGVDIAGATGSTYVTTQADVGSALRVIASYTDGQGTPESVASANTAAVANVNDAPSGSVSIDDTTPAQGQTLTASNTLADPDGLGAITYQWQRGGVDIAGATGSTYVTTQADVGSVLRVIASYTDGQGTPESVASADTAAVANLNDAPTGGVTIDDATPTQGQTLTAANTLADLDGLGAITYQWQRGGVDIAGATGSTYVTTQADVGSALRVVASYTDAQGTPESVASADTAAVANVNDAPTGGVSIDDTTPTQGQMLTAANTLADLDGLGSISYQWQRGGVDIAGATGSTYVTTQADVGSALRVVASYTDGQGTQESVASADTAVVTNVNDPPTGGVTIDDTTPTQGQTLAASNTLADLDGFGAISYQWQRGGVDIVGATGSTYVTTQADVGSVLRKRPASPP